LELLKAETAGKLSYYAVLSFALLSKRGLLLGASQKQLFWV